MKISEIIARNPFPASKVQEILYHGTNAKFDTFDRALHGIYVTPIKSWARSHYGNNVIPVYANVKKLIELDWGEPEEDRIIDLFYDRDYDALKPIIDGWIKQGYNCCKFGGESDSMILFGNIEIVNADSGTPM